jgi:flagellar FliL protein
MSKKKQSDDETASTGGKGGKAGKAKTIGLAVVFLVLGAVVGPKLLGGGSAAGGSEAPTTTTVPEGPMVVLDAVTLNLDDGHLLQIGLAFELDPEHEADDGHGEADKDDPTKGYAKALDTAIDVFGGESMADLSAPGGREAAKDELERRLVEEYHGEITGVYFHQFVMQ